MVVSVVFFSLVPTVYVRIARWLGTRQLAGRFGRPVNHGVSDKEIIDVPQIRLSAIAASVRL